MRAALNTGQHAQTAASPPPLQLLETDEYVDDAFAGTLGEVLIRCNNVLYVRAAPPEEKEGATA